jgi:hypothetical protein
MFNSFAFQAVDGIQNAKKQFVSTFVPQAEIKSALNGFVDAQTNYTKEAITANSVAVEKIVSVFTDRTPYVKFAETLQSYFPTAACAKTAKKAK